MHHERKYCFYIYCPDNKRVIKKIIDAASHAGAGQYRQYLKVAFIGSLQGNWYSQPTAQPLQGIPGKETREPSAVIIITCPNNTQIKQKVCEAILAVHPWQEPVVHILPVEEVSKSLKETKH